MGQIARARSKGHPNSFVVLNPSYSQWVCAKNLRIISWEGETVRKNLGSVDIFFVTGIHELVKYQIHNRSTPTFLNLKTDRTKVNWISNCQVSARSKDMRFTVIFRIQLYFFEKKLWFTLPSMKMIQTSDTMLCFIEVWQFEKGKVCKCKV